MSCSLIPHSDFENEDKWSFDLPERLPFLASPLRAIFYPHKKYALDWTIEQAVINRFQQRYASNNSEHFAAVWKYLDTGRVWSVKNELTAGSLRQIDHLFQTQLIYHGEGVSAPNRFTHPLVNSFVESLFHGAPFSRNIVTWDVIKTVFIDHTHNESEFTRAFYKEIQGELIHLAERVPRNKKEALVWSAFAGHLMTFLPYCFPATGSKICVPLLSQEGVEYTVRLVTYEIEVIDLVMHEMTSPLRALGLTPLEKREGSLLVYPGTAAPGGDGFAASLLTNCTPGYSVGEVMYQRNREVINRWMKDREEISVFGISLGGALALHTLHEHHQKLTRLDVFNPPGLYPGQWVNQLNEGCTVNIWCQAGDLVKHLGVWPTDPHVSLYLLVPGDMSIAKGFRAHAHVYSGCKELSILKLDPKIENAKRKRALITLIHRLGGWLVYVNAMLVLWKRYIFHYFRKKI